jgi:hypothetical protein
MGLFCGCALRFWLFFCSVEFFLGWCLGSLDVFVVHSSTDMTRNGKHVTESNAALCNERADCFHVMTLFCEGEFMVCNSRLIDFGKSDRHSEKMIEVKSCD